MSCAFAELPSCPAGQPVDLILADARADGRSRRVHLGADRITIERSLEGIAMRLSVAVEAYEGVCVGLKPGDGGRPYYELRLEHRDADLSVTLREAPDDHGIWADWRAWAAYFGLPTLIERSDGIAPQGDASQEDIVAFPRRRARRRRAAFVRRRRSQAPAPSVVHRGAEIIARN